MLNQILLRAVPQISTDQIMTALRIGLLTATLVSMLLLTGTASAEPIPGLVGG
jgi:hypothetical protein